MPTYGRGYTVANPGALASNSSYGQPFSGPSTAGPATQVPGVLAYYEITQQIANGTLTWQWDAATLTPYAYNSKTGEWVSYDNPESLAYKTAYVNAIGLGGAMVWSIDDDDFANSYPLMAVITDILNNPALGPQLPAGLQPSFPVAAYTTTINPNVNWGTWEGWGTSLAWWAKAFGDQDNLADIFFTMNSTYYNPSSGAGGRYSLVWA